MSATPEKTAESWSKCSLKALDSNRAMVVLPVPGGPHRMMEWGRPFATIRPSGPSGLSK